ncbi:MAG TPA: hypothetical protein VGF78_10035, partial [Candidatus Dormibacteraeota bacterium]
EYQGGAQVGPPANVLRGLDGAPSLAPTVRPGPPTTDGHGCGNQRIKLASELKLQKPVEIVHL